jgi:selenocysteine-specific translation elongation factor
LNHSSYLYLIEPAVFPAFTKMRARSRLHRLMPNLNVAVLGSPGYSKELGKKGTQSDVTFYNLKRGEDTVTLLEPTRYPERLASLFYAASFADTAILVVEGLDAHFGESVLMLKCAGVERGIIVLRNYITPAQVGRFIKGTILEGYAYADDDPVGLREALLEMASRPEDPVEEAWGTVVVDHAFNVRGVGPVALGTVKEGVIARHGSLSLPPGEKVAQVRSIQKHDDDFESARAGDRVGVALKNVDVGDLERGAVLTSRGDMRATTEFTSEAELVPYWLNPLSEGMVLHLGHWMQFNAAKLFSVEENGLRTHLRLTLSLERPLVHPPGARAVIAYLNGGNLRVVGTIGLP